MAEVEDDDVKVSLTDGYVLSDVHVQSDGQSVHINGADLTVSRFPFRVPMSLMCDEKDRCPESEKCGRAESIASASESETDCDTDSHPSESDISKGASEECVCDEDGDFIIKRKTADGELVITIVHAMATDLHLVGQQVWLGALLLCDFMLHYSELLAGNVVADLGAGVGLTTIVAAFQASTVFCTDRGDDILSLARHNIDQNSNLHQNGDIRVCELDWNAAAPLTADSGGSSKETKRFSLSEKDFETLRRCSIILAAEVVYDQALTDAFFRLLYKLLLERPTKTVYMTVEKRQVFSVADLDVVSPAYEHFRENLQDLSGVDEGPVRFLCSPVDISFPQYFHYQRTKELELWKIEAVFVRP